MAIKKATVKKAVKKAVKAVKEVKAVKAVKSEKATVKKTMSKAGRAAISEAQKKRWEAYHKLQRKMARLAKAK